MARMNTINKLKPPHLSWRMCLLLIVILTSPAIMANIEPNLFRGLDFHLNSNRSSVIVVELTTNNILLDIRRSRHGLSVEIIQTRVKKDDVVIYDVTEFGAAVSNIEVSSRDDSVILDISIEADFNFDYQILENKVELIISTTQESSTNQITPASYDKESKRISVNFHEIPVRQALQLIADLTKNNVAVSEKVQNNLTLRLDDVSWRKVLDVILKINHLEMQIEGDVVVIAPRDEIKMQQHDLQSEIVKINFAKAADIAQIIDGEGEMKLLSERGYITSDERTNAILIRDQPKNITAIRDVITHLDVPVKQVQIEARIVTINEGDLDELGVRWGLSHTSGDVTTGGSIESNLAAIGLYSPNDENLPIDDFLNVNLGLSNPNAASIAFQVAKLGSDTLLDLELSALQTESKAEIISSPRLITTNKMPAYIEQGTEIPYLEAASSGATSVSFRKAVLSLMVTPQITPDNRLVLDLNITQDRPGETVKTGRGEAVAINTQRIGTQILVNNGETVVLGGIYQNSVVSSTEKVPLLGDLPYLGRLFKRTSEKLSKSELLIFITPKVISQR